MLTAFALTGLWGCEQDDIGILNKKKVDETPGTLKSVASFPIGFAIDYSTYMNSEPYRQILGQEVTSTTFGYSMKHGALVDDGGTINFTQADALYDAVTAQGVDVFGHTLGWHQNQNATYLKTVAKGTSGAPNLLLNGDLELGTGDNFDSWGKWNGGALMTATTVASENHAGTRALKAAVTGAQSNAGQPWSVQFVSEPATTEIGKDYTFSMWVKAGDGGGNIRFSTNPSALYSADYAISTDWAQVTWTFTANATATRIVLDLGKTNHTFFIDDMKLVDPNYTPPVLMANGGFEDGAGDNFTNWGKWNGGALMTATTNASEIHGGARALKVAVTGAQSNAGQPWSVQMVSDPITTTIGTTYTFSVWMKANAAGGNIRFSTNPNAKYSADYNIGADWTQVSWTFEANEAATRIVLDLGKTNFTFFVDDAKLVDPSLGGGDTGDSPVEDALNDFITKTVTHYKGKVKAWDVVNEAVTENGSLRTSDNTTVPQGATDMFFWADYMGEDWILKAFEFAAAADPDALLFINDYNLESSSAKLDGLLALVDEMKTKGAKIDGIGTQMHISINTSRDMIDKMFQKLAATGLKIRVSELDVRANPYDKPDFDSDTHSLALDYQAAMYEYVIDSYIKYVPAAQRHGITIWGIHDADSWIVLYQNKIDAPLLFDKTFQKKSAFHAVKSALQKASGN